ncbi:MAG: hypothetical protein ACOY3K_05130 [Candidatus Omnitrophota bacterium]
MMQRTMRNPLDLSVPESLRFLERFPDLGDPLADLFIGRQHDRRADTIKSGPLRQTTPRAPAEPFKNVFPRQNFFGNWRWCFGRELSRQKERRRSVGILQKLFGLPENTTAHGRMTARNDQIAHPGDQIFPSFNSSLIDLPDFCLVHQVFERPPAKRFEKFDLQGLQGFEDRPQIIVFPPGRVLKEPEEPFDAVIKIIFPFRIGFRGTRDDAHLGILVANRLIGQAVEIHFVADKLPAEFLLLIAEHRQIGNTGIQAHLVQRRAEKRQDLVAPDEGNAFEDFFT